MNETEQWALAKIAAATPHRLRECCYDHSTLSMENLKRSKKHDLIVDVFMLYLEGKNVMGLHTKKTHDANAPGVTGVRGPGVPA